MKDVRLKYPQSPAWRCNPAPQNPQGGEVSGRRVSKAGGKWLLPGTGDLSMQIAEKWQLPPFKLGMCTDEEAPVELRSSRGSSGQSSASFSVARESTSTSSE